MKKKVVIGMSGGVDSSVAAYLLKEQGYDVTGVTMQFWQTTEENEELLDAKKVAEAFGITHVVADFRDEFKKKVVDYFISEYIRGYTPNPCNMCNRYMKWEALLQKGKELGADYVATGHYAQIVKLPNGRYSIQNAKTSKKDQTYALYNLTQEQLEKTLMPVGLYEKEEIRKIATDIGLEVAAKKDSQDICFIPDGDYSRFITASTGKDSCPGDFVDEEGKVLGQHKGIIHYTIGQRKGLGISAETPLFVKELKVVENQVVLCRSESLFSTTCLVSNVNYMSIDGLREPKRAIGKIRYSHAGSICTLYPQKNGQIRCEFEEPQRAMTPGQAAVFYEGDHILCGGIIER